MNADVNVTSGQQPPPHITMPESLYTQNGFKISGNSSFEVPGGIFHGTVWLPASVNLVRGACLVAISILGASFNTFMIVAIVPNRRLRTVRNILLVHLGGVGLFSSIFSTMYPALVIFHGKWVGGQSMCQTYAYVTCVFTSVSVWTIAALSWDKYQTIASPLHHSLTATIRKMLPCFLVFWACGLVLSLPPLFGANEYTFHATMGICGVNSSNIAGRWYSYVLVCLSFLFPFCLMIYCYAHIFRIARTQSSRIAATMLRMVSVIQAPIAPTTQNSLSLRGTKAMGTILQLIGSFVLTYLPYSIIILYEVIFAVHANAVFVSIATTLFLAAPFTHAAIYGIRNQILRTSFYRYARRKFQHCCHKDKRRGSFKAPNHQPKSSAAAVNSARLPMKCVVNKNGKQYVLRRSQSYQGEESHALAQHNGGGNGLHNHNNHHHHIPGFKTSLPFPRAHSFDAPPVENNRSFDGGTEPSTPCKDASSSLLRKDNRAPRYANTRTSSSRHNEGKHNNNSNSNSKYQEMTFSGVDDASCIVNYDENESFAAETSTSAAQYASREFSSYYNSKDIAQEMSMMDAEMDEIYRYDEELLSRSDRANGDDDDDDDDDDDEDDEEDCECDTTSSTTKSGKTVERNKSIFEQESVI